MNRLPKHPLAGTVSPCAVPATPIGCSPNTTRVGELNGNLPIASPLVCCPDCDSSLVHRITDVDTGMSYPVDDGEAYCETCDHLWTADEIIPARPSTMTIEEAEARIARVFGLTGWARAEAAAVGGR